MVSNDQALAETIHTYGRTCGRGPSGLRGFRVCCVVVPVRCIHLPAALSAIGLVYIFEDFIYDVR